MTEHSVGALDGTALRQDFTSAMRRLIATVTIITSGDHAARAGMVATAVMSVSADPPSLAVGIHRGAGVWQPMQDTGRFSVNLLATHHAPLVHPFSGQLQGEERFTLGEWHTHATQTPYLADAVVSLFCRVDGKLDYGTHTLFVGAVDEIRMNDGGHEPLLWRDGSFANAVPLNELLGQ